MKRHQSSKSLRNRLKIMQLSLVITLSAFLKNRVHALFKFTLCSTPRFWESTFCCQERVRLLFLLSRACETLVRVHNTGWEISAAESLISHSEIFQFWGWTAIPITRKLKRKQKQPRNVRRLLRGHASLPPLAFLFSLSLHVLLISFPKHWVGMKRLENTSAEQIGYLFGIQVYDSDTCPHARDTNFGRTFAFQT